LADAGAVRAAAAAAARGLAALPGAGGLAPGVAWLPAFALVHAAYFAAHAGLASQTAHVAALYAPALAALVASGAPGGLAALSLAYASCLNAALTPFASGQAVVYAARGYLSPGEVWRGGAASALLAAAAWGAGGMAWWRLLGWW